MDSDVFGYHESMALHAFDDKIKINLIFSSKNLYIPIICSTFATAIELTAIAKLEIERI